MTRYRITHRAAADLRDIGRFTQDRWGRNARIAYLRRVARVFGQLAANPTMGRPRPEISKAIRVVHQAMDYPPHP